MITINSIKYKSYLEMCNVYIYIQHQLQRVLKF